jgi:hypothetical protein
MRAAAGGARLRAEPAAAGWGMQSGKPIQVGRGPRAVEALLLAELDALVEAGRREPDALRAPVRVVVPSRSLAQHLQAALLRHAGRAVLGCRVQTLQALAFEIVERAGRPAAGSELLFPVLVRQLGRREPALRERLDALVDGYGIVGANVDDLLDAGFEEAHAEALEEAIVAATPAGELRERALAVGRVAARAAQAVATGRVGHRCALFRRARELLERDPEGVLVARAVLIHGYADATGVQADLLEGLVRCRDARLFLDRPADPSAADREDPGVAFGRRFAARFVGAEAAEPSAPRTPARLEVWYAPGPQAEVAALAARLRELLDAGARAEGLGVALRGLRAYRLPLRRSLQRLGIPFSGLAGEGSPGPAARRLEALQVLLQQGERTPAEGWLDVAELEGCTPGQRTDLRLALHAVGAARLGDVARLRSVEEGAAPEALELPVRQGLAGPEEGVGSRAPRRRLARALLDSAIRAARALAADLASAGPREPLGRHLARLRAITEEGLGWRGERPELDALRAVWDEAGAARDFELDHDDFLLLLRSRLRGLGRAPLGGAGAGVQVLDVMEARARTFDHLFVLGLNRDVFPRTITEDPLLPDELRLRLRAVLPDLPVKGDGHDEERFLFAQLLAASPELTLSCAVSDDDGKARPVSPLLERLRLAEGAAPPRRLSAPYGAAALAAGVARPAGEQALLAGMHGTRRQFGALLPLALEEASRETGGANDGRALAPARLAVLDELDATAGSRRAPGPYFGFVGPVREAADPRRQPLFVTTAEALAACPWQAFLGRLLRLELLPDALDALPAVEPRLVGSLVHAVLERIAGDALGSRRGRLGAVAARDPLPIPWPDPTLLEGMLHAGARSLLRAEGIALPGFERVLAGQAQPRLEVARALGMSGVLGAEVEGELDVADAAGVSRSLRFKADRVDRVGGELRLVDYKTGKPLATQKRAQTRHRALLRSVAAGVRLQAMAYALAARELGSPAAEGCYASLDPDPELEPERRLLTARADDEELAEAFRDALHAVLAAFHAGSFFPRLLKPGGDEEPRRCRRCEVKEACLRGDSGARARLAAWAAAPPRSSPGDAERAMRELWDLGGEGS